MRAAASGLTRRCYTLPANDEHPPCSMLLTRHSTGAEPQRTWPVDVIHGPLQRVFAFLRHPPRPVLFSYQGGGALGKDGP